MNARTQKLFDAAKAKTEPFSGVDVTHLSLAERRDLTRAGLHLVIDRKRRVCALYPMRLRADDLRAKVNAIQAAKSL
jgi:hypothetical protein